MLKQLIRNFLRDTFAKNYITAQDIVMQQQPSVEAILSVPQEEVVGSIYPECRDLFKQAMQDKRLTREQIIYFKDKLNERLGTNRRYYNKSYKNDAHEIYTKLKSPFLDNKDYEVLINTIMNFIRIY
jgi:hypothetical protein